MKRVLLAFCLTAVGLVMLLSFKTQALGTAPSPLAAGTTTPVDPSTPTASTPTPTTGTGSPATTTAPSPGASSPAVADATYVGTAAQTRYGPVQVQITVVGGKVTAVEAVDYPQDNPRDAEINARAIPTLNAEATKAGSAKIDTVSGATYTSDGYLQSLQSALDEAGL